MRKENSVIPILELHVHSSLSESEIIVKMSYKVDEIVTLVNLPVPVHRVAADATHTEHFRQIRVTIGGACRMWGVSDWCSHGCKRGQNLS